MCLYMTAHPKSDIGDPNEAIKAGWVLVAIQPNDLRVYRRINWIERLLGLYR